MYIHTFERSLQMTEDIEDFWTRPPLHGVGNTLESTFVK